MSSYDIMYLIGGIVGLACLAIWFDPAMRTKHKAVISLSVLAVFFLAAYLILGNEPIPENHIFPIQL